MRKRIINIIALCIYITLFVIGLIDKTFTDYNFVSKIFIVPFLVIIKYCSFGNYVAIGIVICVLYENLIIPNFNNIGRLVMTFAKYGKTLYSILIIGRIVDDEDEDPDVIDEMMTYDRAYKRFFFYTRRKDIPVFSLFLIPLFSVWLTFVMIGIYQFIDGELTTFDYRCLWIKDIRNGDIWLGIIYIVIYSMNAIFQMFVYKENKKAIIVNLLLNMTICYFAFKTSIICLIGITSILGSKFKKIGGKNNEFNELCKKRIEE